MVRINLIPGIRRKLRSTAMARECCIGAFIFLGLTLAWCSAIVLSVNLHN